MLLAARARGVEVGARDTSSGTGVYLRCPSHLRSSGGREVGTGFRSRVLVVTRGMIESGTLTSIDDEAEHARIARIAFTEADISPQRYRLIAKPRWML